MRSSSAIGTRLYPDATIPVALAQAFAAYPLHNADRVLRLHAETLMEDRLSAPT